MALFTELGLLPELMKSIAEEGYTEPTPIQEKAIPVVLAGNDLLGAAQTGTGKTASFALPILQRLQPNASASPSPARHPIRALILTPTRELAVQVFDSFKAYGRHIPLRSAVIYGGVNMDAQIAELRAGVEIVVATPGRLLDHVQQKTINLSQVQVFVLDEADRMLDMGFIRDIRRVMELLPPVRQNLLFSATFSKEITELANTLLKNPVTVEVARRNAAAETVRQVVYLVEQESKRALLTRIIKDESLTQVLVFARTKHGANRLAGQLVRDGINAAAIHSNKTQGVREQALADFKEGKVAVLVATDIAARGLDIEQLPHVVNFDIPHTPEDYVHRIGRTGRAGLSGDAISLVAPEELKQLKEIEKLLKREIARADLGAVATPMAARATEADKPHRERAPRHPPTHGHATRKPAPVKHHDPIFTQPYVPQETSSAAPDISAGPHPAKRSRPVPVLFGGGKGKSPDATK